MMYDDARAAVAGGADPMETARRVVAGLDRDELLWCLDGDAPTWAGLKALTHQDIYHRVPFVAAELERVGFPGVRFADGPRGCVVANATAFPVPMARGATWDPELEVRVGEAIGTELRAVGADLTGAVCVNVLRHPAWGRAQETYGEDPHHVGELGAAVTRGLQRWVMACMKHFACNSMENARFSVDIEVDEVALHEVYLPHFKRIAEEGIASVMTAYNSVNGEWCGQSPALISDVLRGEWGFKGFTISDWIFGLRDGPTSVAAGLDIEMPYRMVRAQSVPAALEAGEVEQSAIEAAAARVIATRLRFDEVLGTPAPPLEVLGSPQHRALAQEVAARSVVLLRNEPVEGEPVLPLRPKQRVAVVGRLADRVNLGDGGSSDVWDLDCETIADGLRAAFDSVDHADGTDLDHAIQVAQAAEVVVVVVGYTAADEGEFIGATDPELSELFPSGDEPDVVARYEAYVESGPPATKPDRLADRPKGFSVGGDRTSLRLLPGDVALIQAVAAANPRTVVAIQAGSAVIVDEWIESVPALVQPWYGGCRAGSGLAQVLLGEVNPSARLPFSVPHHEDDLPAFDRDARTFTYDRWHGWWHLERTGRAPAYPFGYGLSYTKFAVTDSAVTNSATELTVIATLANTGHRDGADVVQVYAEIPTERSGEPAPPRLIGFQRIEVAAGDAASVTMEIPLARLARRDPRQHEWVLVSGTYRIHVARFAGDPNRKTHDITIEGADEG